MNTNFTFRDFFVYLIVGVIALFSICVIYANEIFDLIVELFYQYEFIKEFNVLILIFLIPIIYIIGHIVGGISYHLFYLYIWLEELRDKKTKKTKKKKKCFFKLSEKLLFKQRVSYAIRENNKSFKDNEDFWEQCAELQVKGHYEPAEYWYVLNELFNSINIIFFASSVITFFRGKFILGIIFLFLAIFSFIRAKQYAQHFVKTVSRLIKVKN